MSDLTRIYASGDPFAGELMKGRLEAEGIAVMLKGEGEGPYRTGPVYLWVNHEDEERARTVLEAVDAGAFAVTDEEVMEASEAASEPTPEPESEPAPGSSRD